MLFNDISVAVSSLGLKKGSMMNRKVIFTFLCMSINVYATTAKPKPSVVKTLCGVSSSSGYGLPTALLQKLKVKQLTNGTGKLPLAVNLIVPAKLNDIHVSRYHLVLKVPTFSYVT